jgi:hypothetical protein
MRGPNNSEVRRIHAVGVKSGNRWVFLALLTSFVALGAADAGRVYEDGSGMVWTAAELLAPDGVYLSGCRVAPLPQRAALHFETVDSHDDTADAAGTMSGGARRMVSFEWKAATGELTFTANGGTAALTLPEDFVKVASDQSIQNCGPR